MRNTFVCRAEARRMGPSTLCETFEGNALDLSGIEIWPPACYTEMHGWGMGANSVCLWSVVVIQACDLDCQSVATAHSKLRSAHRLHMARIIYCYVTLWMESGCVMRDVRRSWGQCGDRNRRDGFAASTRRCWSSWALLLSQARGTQDVMLCLWQFCHMRVRLEPGAGRGRLRPWTCVYSRPLSCCLPRMPGHNLLN
mgnify:CR=1 FL=1